MHTINRWSFADDVKSVNESKLVYSSLIFVDIEVIISEPVNIKEVQP